MGFVDGSVSDSRAGSYGGLQEKSFSEHLKFLTILVLPLPPQNEIQLLSRFFFYSKLVCICGLRSSSPRNRRCRGFESHLDEYATSMRNYSAGLYQNRISNNFRKTADLKKNVNCKLKLHSKVLYKQGFGTVSVLKFLQTLVLCK